MRVLYYFLKGLYENIFPFNLKRIEKDSQLHVCLFHKETSKDQLMECVYICLYGMCVYSIYLMGPME